MLRPCKTIVVSFLFLLMLLSACDMVGADATDYSADMKAEDQLVIDNYKRLCVKLDSGLEDIASDIQDISNIELKENMPSGNGSLLAVRLTDIVRGLSASCNKNKNVKASLNELGNATASFGRALEKALTTQPNVTDTDHRLMNGYREVASKISILADDMNTLFDISPDYIQIISH